MHEPTRYELAVTDTAGQRWLVAYSARHTQNSVRANYAAVHPQIASMIDDSAARWDGARKRYVSSTWAFGFTGRTERVARQEGELPRIVGGR